MSTAAAPSPIGVHCSAVKLPRHLLAGQNFVQRALLLALRIRVAGAVTVILERDAREIFRRDRMRRRVGIGQQREMREWNDRAAYQARLIELTGRARNVAGLIDPDRKHDIADARRHLDASMAECRRPRRRRVLDMNKRAPQRAEMTQHRSPAGHAEPRGGDVARPRRPPIQGPRRQAHRGWPSGRARHTASRSEARAANIQTLARCGTHGLGRLASRRKSSATTGPSFNA